MKSRASRAARYAFTVLLGLIITASTISVPGFAAWAKSLGRLSLAEMGPVLLATGVAVICLLVVGATSALGKRIPVALVALPVLLPSAVGLATTVYVFHRLRLEVNHMTTLESRLVLFAHTLEELDAPRVAGIFLGGLLALVTGTLTSCYGLSLIRRAERENRRPKIAALVTAPSVLVGGLIWHAGGAGWPFRFQWLALGALVLSALFAAALSTKRMEPHARIHTLAAFTFATSASLFGLAEYALCRDRALGTMPASMPFSSNRGYLTDMASLSRPDAWSPVVDAALVVAMFFVPPLFSDALDRAERKLSWAFAGGVMTLSALGAFDLHIARVLADLTAPLTRFKKVSDVTPPAGIGEAIDFGPALFVTRQGSVLYDATEGTAPPLPLTKDAMPDKTLVALAPLPERLLELGVRRSDKVLLCADQQLSFDRLWTALAPVRDNEGLQVKLILGTSVRRPSFGGLEDIFAGGELGARTVVMTERYESAIAWAKARQAQALLLLFEGETVQAFNSDSKTLLPPGDSPFAHERRREYYRAYYEKGTPQVFLIAVAPNQQMADIVALVLDFDTALPLYGPYGPQRWLAPIILTGDREAFEAARR